MYGEADYFKIEALKQKTSNDFRLSFRACPGSLGFSGVIQKLYSEHADHQPLKDIALKAIRDNLSVLSRDEEPLLRHELLQLVPEFAIDLCLETVAPAKLTHSGPRVVLVSSSLDTQPDVSERSPEDYQGSSWFP